LQAKGIVGDLARRRTLAAERALVDGMVAVAFDADDTAVLHRDHLAAAHAAERADGRRLCRAGRLRRGDPGGLGRRRGAERRGRRGARGAESLEELPARGLVHHSGKELIRYIAAMSGPAVLIELNHFSKIGTTSPER